MAKTKVSSNISKKKVELANLLDMINDTQVIFNAMVRDARKLIKAIQSEETKRLQRRKPRHARKGWSILDGGQVSQQVCRL